MVRAVSETGETTVRCPSDKHELYKDEHVACHAAGHWGKQVNYGIFHKILQIIFGTAILEHCKKAPKLNKNLCLILNRKEKIVKQYE